MLASVTSALPTSALEAIKAPIEQPEQINSISDLIVHKAHTAPNAVLLAYPQSDHGSDDLVEYTSKDIDQFVDESAKGLTGLGLIPKETRTNKSQVVALLGPSNLDYAITLLAISRMGFTVLLLSTRLPIEAYISLLKKTGCTDIVLSERFVATAREINNQYAINTFPIPDQAVYKTSGQSRSRFQRSVELFNEEQCLAFIVHSSGSTGLPKPIFQTHRACLSNYATGGGMRAFVTLPLFHNHGISTMFRGIVASKRTVLYNTNLTLTNANMIRAIEVADPQSFHGVPYALKVLPETEEGIAALRKCNIVWFGGSSCPDELGDMLVDAGVYLVGHYGATEMGQLMTSVRDPEDKAWNYMRPFPKVMPYLRFIAIGEGMYELMVLDGLPAKVASNSDDPPNSFYTSDTFVPHSTIPNAWKYMGRLDDRVTLVNGEKVLPIPYEHRIRQSELVQECLVFGVDRAFPGLLIVPSEKAKDFTKAESLEELMPLIKVANENAEKFGYISKEMVEIMDRDVDYPRTDKGTMIRAASYKRFAALIDSVYTRFETPVEGQLKRLDIAGLRTYLLDLFSNRVGVENLSNDTDFFEAGTDSLQAIAGRSHIMHEIDLGGANSSGQNIVFEHPSIEKLAQHINSLSHGETVEQNDEIVLMNELLQKYSTFPAFVPGDKIPTSEVVLLTGSTGTLGAHLLSQLVQLPHISRVYCPVRASSLFSAHERLIHAVSSKRLSIFQTNKIFDIPSDLSKLDLGLDPLTLSEVRTTLTSVIHSAWAVNFNLRVASFESHHIGGTYNLLRLCQSVPFSRPARFSFVSSVSAAAGTPPPAVIAETYVADAAHAQAMGYARSKWVTEHIVRAAAQATGQDARVLRTGQIVADTQLGLWNQTEAIPLMIRTAVTLGVLPTLDEAPSWLPVDKCAEAVLDLSGVRTLFDDNNTPSTGSEAQDLDVVYHVENSHRFRWTEDLLPALRNAGLEFEIVPQREWVQRLREGEQDPMKNPTIKLLDFFTAKYDNDKPGRRGLTFAKEKTSEKSKVIADGVDVVGSGLVGKFVKGSVDAWRQELGA